MEQTFDERVTSVLEELVEKAKTLFPDVVFEQIGWQDCLKGLTAGRAYLREDIIQINKNVPAEGIEQTVVHEFAHLVATKIGGVKVGHGKIWKDIMLKLGYSPERTHRYNLPRHRVLRKHVYMCMTCGKSYTVSARRHKQIDSLKIRIRCDCGQLLSVESYHHMIEER